MNGINWPGTVPAVPAMANTYSRGDDMGNRTCTVEGCERSVVARCMCRTHYGRWWTWGDARPDIPVRRADRTLEQRFWDNVDRRGPDDCWEWRGADNGRGYGHFHPTKGSDEYAHRFSYVLANGAIPEGMVVRHSCDNPPCVNPAHLTTGTQLDNVRDMQRRGRAAARHFRAWTDRCAWGHARTAENTVWPKSGDRACRPCRSVMGSRAYKAADRATRRAMLAEAAR